jgi:hypothetical protein
MALIQIGAPETKAMTSVREMFERLAQQEAEMVRAARERMQQSSASRLSA